MAKSNSTMDLGGTYDGITYVKSRAYGKHIRAARGTYKEAKVNEAFKSSSKRLAKANRPAKIFKDAIDPYRADLYDGSLWQRLLSMFRKQLKDHGSFDFSKLEQFEIHSRYPLDELLSFQPKITVDKKESILRVDLSNDKHPTFKKSHNIDGYKLSVIAIYPDLKKEKARTVAIHSEIIGLEGKPAPLSMQLTIPPRAKDFVVCIRCDGCRKGKVDKPWATKGMRVVGAGVV